MQKKSLQHAVNKLSDFSQSKTYTALAKFMINAEIDNNIKIEILKIYSDNILIEAKKVFEAESWVKALLEDL